MSDDDEPVVDRRVVDEPLKLIVELAEAGSDWRKVWLTLETLGVFDDTYMADGWEAFCHNHVVYWREAETQRWTFEMDVSDFLKDNPPNEECLAVLKLHEYAAGIEQGSDPWLLFQYVTGIAATTQSIGLASLMGISEQESVLLGAALYGYGSKASIVHPYVELLLSFEDAVVP